MDSFEFNFKNAIISSLIIIPFFVLGAALFINPQVRETMVLATTQKPETFTELYLENHLKLPKETTTDKVHTFTFTIHNLEYQTVIYPYEVVIQKENGEIIDLIVNQVELKHDETKQIPVNYVFKQPVDRAKVTVNLKNKDQAIHFWVGKPKE